MEDSAGSPVAREFRVLDLSKEVWPGPPLRPRDLLRGARAHPGLARGGRQPGPHGAPLRAHHGADRQGAGDGPDGRPHPALRRARSSSRRSAPPAAGRSRCGAGASPSTRSTASPSAARPSASTTPSGGGEAYGRGQQAGLRGPLPALLRERPLPHRRRADRAGPGAGAAPRRPVSAAAEREALAPELAGPARADPGLRLDRDPLPQRGAGRRRVRQLVPRGPGAGRRRGRDRDRRQLHRPLGRDRRGARRARASARPSAASAAPTSTPSPSCAASGSSWATATSPTTSARSGPSSTSSPRATSSSWAAASAATSSPARCPSCTGSSARPLTTWILNRMYGSRFSDIHCGMRAMTADALRRIDLQSQSWEYASEMVVKAAKLRLRTDRGAGALLQGPRGAREPPQAHRAGGRPGRRAGATSA